MKRGGPPRRREAMKRGGSLRARSPKRVARDRQEAAVKRDVLARDGGCVLRAWQGEEFHGEPPAAWVVTVPRCSGPIDKHETIPRSLWPDGCLERTNCVALCRGHHDWIESTRAARAFARSRGLLRGSADRPRGAR